MIGNDLPALFLRFTTFKAIFGHSKIFEKILLMDFFLTIFIFPLKRALVLVKKKLIQEFSTFLNMCSKHVLKVENIVKTYFAKY
jgi:hypothetical protein